MKLKHDKFQKVRDGKSRLLNLKCTNCEMLICTYQKDGIGHLKRLYLDRITSTFISDSDQSIKCPQCQTLIGMKTIYKKENRLAFQLIPGKLIK